MSSFFSTAMIKVYGIKNCNTMQKAFAWLNENKIEFEFHDYKKLGIEESTIKNWLKKNALDELINKKGTTFKKLPETTQVACKIEASAIPLMQQFSSMIKRPILEKKELLLLGFHPEIWSKKLLN